MVDVQALEREVVATLERYLQAFERGTRDDLQAFCLRPIAYVTDDEVQLRDRYPFDPVKLREVTGMHSSDAQMRVLHVDAARAHVQIDATRRRADGSAIERVGAVYVLLRRDGAWKIALISGVRSA